MDQEWHFHDCAAARLDPDSGEIQHKADFFRKLGYSSAEVRAALGKLGLSTDTNSVLGELVRSRTVDAGSPSVPSLLDGDENPPAPSWAPGPRRGPPSPPSQQEETGDAESELKAVVIDGSNVAMSHGNKEVFSCRGIQLAVSYFLSRGHTSITVFVPTWRKEQPRPDAPITDQHILTELEKKKIVVFTPSRRVGGKRVVCYDDRFIVKFAYESDAVIVSNDTYRDLQGERPEWKKCVEESLLMYSFVNDKFMPPDDPMGRHGPSLENLLRKRPLPVEQKRQLCPYDKKCTYGIKCKFYHPERANQSYCSLADELRENARISAVKEERISRSPPGGPQSDLGHSHNPHFHSLEFEMEHKLSLNQHSSLYPGQLSKNTFLCRNGPRTGLNRTFNSAVGGCCQKEWIGPQPVPSSPFASICHEHLDSGLGSYESQYADVSQRHSKPHRSSKPQQHGLFVGAQQSPVYMKRQHHDAACKWCSSPVVPPIVHQQYYNTSNLESCSQHGYNDTCPPSIHHRHHYNLPNQLQHSKRMYWSDPFQAVPAGRASRSLPTSTHSPCPHMPASFYRERQHHSWAQRPPSAVFDPERLQLRKKLQAIFNPVQVDMVMEMYPHIMDAQKLAVEILKAPAGMF
ncbi:ribonuclease ZC3H12A [Lampris incognitus]|uniref:ribonuclease ZC3H12A n=1 Tax=Lampris incognitus TaxID=2546036 RepID=UPI0024B4C49D|nr:ribonuclease ZC3H12A [Lampris incognitus]